MVVVEEILNITRLPLVDWVSVWQSKKEGSQKWPMEQMVDESLCSSLGIEEERDGESGDLVSPLFTN